MPIYDYKCGKCDHVESILVKASEKQKALPCPKCGQEMKPEFPLIAKTPDKWKV